MSDYYAHRDLGNGYCLWVYPLTFGRARLVLGPCDASFYDDAW